MAATIKPEDIAEIRRMVADGEVGPIRVAARLHKTEIARSLGVSHSALCRWEKGSRMPSGDVAVAYLRLLKRLAAARNSCSSCAKILDLNDDGQ